MKKISAEVVGRHIGISAVRVRELRRAGAMPASGDLDAQRLAYIEHLRGQAAGRASAGDLDLTQERAALAREQRKKTELERRKLEGELVDVQAVRRAAASMVTATRNALLQIGARLAPVVAAESDPLATRRCIDTEIESVLMALSDDLRLRA